MKKENIYFSVFTCIGNFLAQDGNCQAIAETNRSFHTVQEKESLSEIAANYIGAYYIFGKENVNNLYLSINPHLINENKIRKGSKVYHPNPEEIFDLIRGDNPSKEKLVRIYKYLKNVYAEKNIHIVKPGETLSEIATSHFGKYYKFGAQNINELYMKANPQIKSPDMIFVGMKIAHPWIRKDEEKIPPHRIIASTETQENYVLKKDEYQESLEVAIDREEDVRASTPPRYILEKEKYEKASFDIGIGNFFTQIDGENLTNNTKAKIISKQNIEAKLNIKYDTDNFAVELYSQYRMYSFRPPESATLINPKFTTLRNGLNYTRHINDYLDIGVNTSYGDKFFQRANSLTSLELIKIQTLEFGPKVGVKLYKGKKLQLDADGQYNFHKFYNGNDEALDKGRMISGGLKFSFPRTWGTPGARAFYEYEEMKSTFYKQETSSNGLLIFYNIEF